MSCLMMGGTPLMVMVNTLVDYMEREYNATHFKPPYSLERVLGKFYRGRNGYDRKAIARELAGINLKAYNDRYNVHDELLPGDVDEDCTVTLFKPWYLAHVGGDWRYKFYKLLDFWLYQVCDSEVKGDKVVLAIRDFRDAFARHVVETSNEYESAPWGDVELSKKEAVL